MQYVLCVHDVQYVLCVHDVQYVLCVHDVQYVLCVHDVQYVQCVRHGDFRDVRDVRDVRDREAMPICRRQMLRLDLPPGKVRIATVPRLNLLKPVTSPA